MTHTAMTPLLGPEFDTFLFAPVDEEGKGAFLSVVSALARLDVDPWREAAELAGMPREAANQRLTSLIAALPDAPEARLAAATIAGRLIKLLPRGKPSPGASREKVLRADPMPVPHRTRNLILINLLVMAGLLGAQWALSNLQMPHLGTAPAVASGAAIPQKPQTGHTD